LLQERIDIGRERPLGSGDRRGADRLRIDRIHQEAVAAVQHLVTRARIGTQQQSDQFVRSGAAHDACRIQAVMPPECGAQFIDGPVGVAVDLACKGAVGGDRLGARPKCALIRRETDRPLDTDDFCIAPDIGRDFQDSRPGRRTRGGHYSLSPSPRV